MTLLTHLTRLVTGAVMVGAVTMQNPVPAFELPVPTGDAPIGTTRWTVADNDARETLAASTGPREVVVTAYYPARVGTGNTAPYLREGREEARALFRAPAGDAGLDALAAVTTHAILDAPPREGSGRLPLLIFSHGYAGFASAYTALLEDLASHGYVVLSINHPYESGGARLANGTFASFLDAEGKPGPAFLEVVGEWSKEDEIMAAVTKAEGKDDEQQRLLRAYLSSIPKTMAALRRWVDDTRLVLDRIATLPPTTIGGQLAGRVDARRVGVFGHSMGGVTAGQFCVEDTRCQAGLNLDGIPQYGAMIDKPLNRPFLMVYSARPGRAGASDPIYRRAATPYYRVDVTDTLHLDFSDMIFWPGLRERKALGAIAPARATAITRAIVRHYFDETLRGRPSTLAGLEKTFTEVISRRYPR